MSSTRMSVLLFMDTGEWPGALHVGTPVPMVQRDIDPMHPQRDQKFAKSGVDIRLRILDGSRINTPVWPEGS